jgi:hypothetical protein
MRSTVVAPLLAALVGLLALSQGATAQQKTVRQCSDEWAAGRATLEASGKTRRIFMAECRGVAADPQAALAQGQFATEAEARTGCAGDTVVWVNLASKIAHPNSSRSYGNTRRGAYMCEKESTAAGFRPARSPVRNAKPADKPSEA